MIRSALHTATLRRAALRYSRLIPVRGSAEASSWEPLVDSEDEIVEDITGDVVMVRCVKL